MIYLAIFNLVISILNGWAGFLNIKKGNYIMGFINSLVSGGCFVAFIFSLINSI